MRLIINLIVTSKHLQVLSVEYDGWDNEIDNENDLDKMFNGDEDLDPEHVLCEAFKLKLSIDSKLEMLIFGRTEFMKKSASVALFSRLNELESKCGLYVWPRNATVLPLELLIE